MIEADMDKYMDFKAITGVFFFNSKKGAFTKMPTNKGEIFSSNEFNLLEKRNLFKLLHSCAGLYNRLNNQSLDINSTLEFDKDNKLSESQIKQA